MRSVVLKRNGMAGGIVGAFVLGCLPAIKSFEAHPARVCSGGSATLIWQAKGHTALTAVPSTSGTGDVPSSGSVTVTVPDTTRFTLTATKRGRSTFSEQEVDTYAPGATVPLINLTKPRGVDSVAVDTTLDAGVWGTALTIATVRNTSGRAMRVVHDGRAVSLDAPGTASDALRGAPVSGPWLLAVALMPGEVIGDPAHSPPDRLGLVVVLACGS